MAYRRRATYSSGEYSDGCREIAVSRPLRSASARQCCTYLPTYWRSALSWGRQPGSKPSAWVSSARQPVLLLAYTLVWSSLSGASLRQLTFSDGPPSKW